ncbi:MarR family winged helix-turn-helix transcriptional regulator [Furfurilactobacillus entadae]|uniref:MarR family winged helix-turn-helix transcriptional regulator n=1 Tax=Furfurilactobacillus entadae TaxID=2922307 RepID=UPI0035EA530C
MAKVTPDDVAQTLRQTLINVRTNDNTLQQTKAAAHISAYQLSLTQLQILQRLAVSDVPVTNSLLATWFAISKPAITKALHKLTSMDLVNRHQNEADHRITTLTLTEAGQLLAEEYQTVDASAKATYHTIADQFSKGDRKLLMKFLTLINEAIHSGQPL